MLPTCLAISSVSLAVSPDKAAALAFSIFIALPVNNSALSSDSIDCSKLSNDSPILSTCSNVNPNLSAYNTALVSSVTLPLNLVNISPLIELTF
jgi:hypothetical protein